MVIVSFILIVMMLVQISIKGLKKMFSITLEVYDWLSTKLNC
jgi:hypothetical protein